MAVYRGGDVFWIWLIALLGDGGLDLGLGAMLIVGASVAIVLGIVGIAIGKRHDRGD